jgi:hypothetical protein
MRKNPRLVFGNRAYAILEDTIAASMLTMTGKDNPEDWSMRACWMYTYNLNMKQNRDTLRNDLFGTRLGKVVKTPKKWGSIFGWNSFRIPWATNKNMACVSVRFPG